MKINVFWFSLLFMAMSGIYAAEVQKEVAQDFKKLENLPDFELSTIAAKLLDADLARFERISSRFQRIAQKEFKNRLGDTGYLWAKGELTTIQFGAHEKGVESVFVSTDGNIISVGAWDNLIKVWEWNGGTYKTIRTIPTDIKPGFYAVDFSSASNRLASSYGRSGIIDVVDVSTGTKIKSFRAGSIRALLFSPDGTTLAKENGSVIELWDVTTGEKRIINTGYSEYIFLAAFSSDGKKLVSSSGINEPIIVWDVNTLKPVEQYKLDKKFIRQSFLPDGKLIAYTNTLPILLKDVRADTQIAKLDHSGFGGYAMPSILTHDGSLLAAVIPSGQVVIWHIQSGKILREFKIERAINRLAFSPDDKTLVAGLCDGSIIAWKVMLPEKQEAKSKK